MKAIDVLMEEHRVIEGVLKTLETAAHYLEAGLPVRPGLFLEAADFVRGFADGCHHKKEEEVLFRTMVDHGVPVEQGPIGVMLQEHEQGREEIRKMRAAAEKLEAGDAGARHALTTSAFAYVELLRGHIFKEDRVLFPMADQAIPPEKQEQVWEGFEHVEHEETGEGVHEKYLALARSLAQEVSRIGMQV